MALTLSGDDGVAGVNGSAATPAIQGTDTNTGLTFGTDTVNVVTGGSTRTTVDSSGRLLVGRTTAPVGTLCIAGRSDSASNPPFIRLDIANATPADGAGLGVLAFGTTSDTSENRGANITALRDGGTWTANSSLPTRLGFYTTADGSATPTERMRLTEAGFLRFGQTTTNSPSQSAVEGVALNPTGQVNAYRDGGSSGVFGRVQDGVVIQWYRGGSQVGTVTVSSSSTAYNTSSDYRLKENVVPLTGAIDRVNQLQVHRFNFIADPDKTVDGFIAHEAQAVVPEAVTGTHDEVDDDGNPVMQGIDQSKLVPLLTAALQEAISKIEALETRVAQLEGGAS